MPIWLPKNSYGSARPVGKRINICKTAFTMAGWGWTVHASSCDELSRGFRCTRIRAGNMVMHMNSRECNSQGLIWRCRFVKGFPLSSSPLSFLCFHFHFQHILAVWLSRLHTTLFVCKQSISRPVQTTRNRPYNLFTRYGDVPFVGEGSTRKARS